MTVPAPRRRAAGDDLYPPVGGSFDGLSCRIAEDTTVENKKLTDAASVLLINSPSLVAKEKHYERPRYPRLSIAYLAGYVREQGIACHAVDAKYEAMSLDAVIARAVALQPRIVGLTAMTPEIHEAAETAAGIKSVLPGATVIIGGPHVTALPEETLREFPVFDIAVIGEGEYALVELARRIDDPVGIPGTVCRTGETLQHIPGQAPARDLDEITFPAWDQFSPSKVYPIIATRGCPFNCIFCMRVSGKRVRWRSPGHIVAEIEALIDQYGIDRIVFHDETFGLDKKWAHNLLDLLIEKSINRKLTWEATTRVDIADIDIYRKMKKAGCAWLAFGVESGNPRILKQSKKGITLEQATRAVAMARQAGLSLGSLFIIGHPNETRQTIQDTIDFAARLDTDTVSCGLMVPYPGTEVAEIVRRGEGNYRVLTQDWRDYNKQIGNVLEFTDISRKELEYCQLKLYLKFFVRYFRVRKIVAITRIIGFAPLLAGAWAVVRQACAKSLRIPGGKSLHRAN